MLTSWVPLSIASLPFAVDAEQISIKSHSLDADNTVNPKRVAIIGAGIAGASAAYVYKKTTIPSSPLILQPTM